jgi:hypothetical protein
MQGLVAHSATSIDGYRYRLHRDLPGNGTGCAVWVMLNPSTADDVTDDPTIRRCRGFAQRWGLSQLVVVNLYARRAQHPRDLWRAADPVGGDNDRHVGEALREAAAARWLVVCAWGRHARPARVEVVAATMRDLGITGRALGTTRSGQPRHPLYVPYGVELRPWASP